MSYPEEQRAALRGSTDPVGTVEPDPIEVHHGPHGDDPLIATPHEPTLRMEERLHAEDRVRAEPYRDQRSDRADAPDVVERFAPVMQRTRLLVAVTAMMALTLVFSLITMVAVLDDGVQDPVLVEGVPCLVQDGEDGQALLFCQR